MIHKIKQPFIYFSIVIVFGIYCPQISQPHTGPDPFENMHKFTGMVGTR